MAKLYNSPMELLALRGICSKDKKVSGIILSQLDETAFHNEESVEAYANILKHIRNEGSPPAYKLLCQDLSLSEETRAFLSEVDGAIKTTEQARHTVQMLDKYRQTRVLYSLVKGVQKKLESNKIDVDEIVDFASRKLSSTMNRGEVEECIFHIGRNSNVADLINKILNEEDDDIFVPTGFQAWDSVNGGLPRGGLITIGGSSGAGKSHMLGQLCKNQSLVGYKVLLVPLEMTEEEQLIRLLANITKIDSMKFSRKELATDEITLAEKRFAKFERKVKKNGGRFSIFRPRYDMSIEEIFAATHPYGADLIYIDYITLLKGSVGEDQWRKLGEIARHGKVYAGNHNKVVVMAAQVNDDGKLKYSQTIKEHSSVAWTFVATKESREKGVLNIDVLKSRNQKGRNFSLKVDYEHSHIYDLSPDEMYSNEDADHQGSSSDKSSYMPDLSGDI